MNDAVWASIVGLAFSTWIAWALVVRGRAHARPWAPGSQHSGKPDFIVDSGMMPSVSRPGEWVLIPRDLTFEGEISARCIQVAGQVKGRLKAEDEVILDSTAWISGVVEAPRVTIAEGAHSEAQMIMGSGAVGGAESVAENP